MGRGARPRLGRRDLLQLPRVARRHRAARRAGDPLTGEIEGLVDRCRQHGGLVSYRDTGDGRAVPYELNTTWYSALNRDDAHEPQSLQVDRFIAIERYRTRARGVPGIYLPSLFGAKNDTEAVLEGREARAINRKTIDEEALFALLGDRGSWVYQVAVRLRRLIKRRVGIPAFHPNAEQRVLFPGDAVFALMRQTRDRRHRVLAVTNVTAIEQHVRLPKDVFGVPASAWTDLTSGRRQRTRGISTSCSAPTAFSG